MGVKKIAASLIAGFLLLTACANEANKMTINPVQSESGQGTDSIASEPGPTASQPDSKATNSPESPQNIEVDGTAGQLYSLAFQAMLSMDDALNENMKYIAIDLSELTQLTEQDKAYILASFNTFGVEVRDAAMEELQQEEDGFKDKMVLEGVLLQVQKVEVSKDAAVIEGSKYRSGSGAIGTRITLKLEKGAWTVTESEMTWIS